MTTNIPIDLISDVRMDLTNRYIKLNQETDDIYSDIEKTLLYYFSKKRYSLRMTLASFKITNYIDDGLHYYYTFNLTLTNGHRYYPLKIHCVIDQIFIVNCGIAIHIIDVTIN
jgi:hypothetical protein